MTLFLFILVICVGGFAAFRLLAPDVYVRLKTAKFNFPIPWRRPNLLKDSTDVSVKEQPLAYDHLPTAIDTPIEAHDMPEELSQKLFKMEMLLIEKNKLIERLQREVQAERAHRNEFEKVKSIMDDEVLRLKDQVRQLKNKENIHA